MKVISDTSPICYLVLIGHIDVLPVLFGAVTILLAESLEADLVLLDERRARHLTIERGL